jgi:hypothetical protein
MSHSIVVPVIEYGVPLPVKTSQSDVYREAFASMKPMGSFVVPTESARQTAVTIAKQMGLSVTSARTEAKGKSWRIWLVPPKSTKPLAASSQAAGPAPNSKEPMKVREIIRADVAIAKTTETKVDTRRVTPPPVTVKEVVGTDPISRVMPSPGKPGQFDIIPAMKRPRVKPLKEPDQEDPEDDDSEDGEFFVRDTAQSIHEKWQLGLITDAEVDLRQERLESIEAGDIETQQRIEHQLIEMHG